MLYKSLLSVCSLFVFSGCDEPEGSVTDRQEDQELQELEDADEEADREFSPLGEITHEPHVSRSTNPGSCSGPSTCYWATGGGIPGAGSWIYAAVCESSGFHVVSGACDKSNSSTTITRSMPFENNVSNVPENECFDDLTTDSGWTCSFTQSSTGAVQVYALCCN